MRIFHFRLIAFIMIIYIFSCDPSGNIKSRSNTDDLAILPADKGGTHEGYAGGNSSAPYGFYIYIPEGYSHEGPSYPLLIFLHGSGEKGDSSSDITALDRVLKYGPPMLIDKREWNPQYPMIVVSPQTDTHWDPMKIHRFIEYIFSNWNINMSRIYITGINMGATGTFDYCSALGSNAYAAAAVPIGGMGDNMNAYRMKKIAIWAFHGEKDPSVPYWESKNMINAINSSVPDVRALFTLFPHTGASASWTITYNGSGIGSGSTDWDLFSMDIYSWMFQYRKSGFQK